MKKTQKKRVHRRAKLSSIPAAPRVGTRADRAHTIARENKDLNTAEIQFRRDLLQRNETAIADDLARLRALSSARAKELSNVQAELAGLDTLLEARR